MSASSPSPEAVQQAPEAWFKVHPLARGVGLLDEQPLFVRLGRHGDEQPLPSPPSQSFGSHRSCLAAGVPDRQAHAARAPAAALGASPAQGVQIQTNSGLGSGVTFDAGGDIVTNAHVVQGASTMRVTLADGRQFPARLVGSYAPDDLAVITVGAGHGIRPARFADSSKLRVASSSWPSPIRSDCRAA